MAPHWQRTRACGPGRFLILGDTTELDFGIGRRVPDPALMGNGGGCGLHLHVALVAGSEDERIISLAGERVHYRKPAPAVENTDQLAPPPLAAIGESDGRGDVIDQVGPRARRRGGSTCWTAAATTSTCTATVGSSGPTGLRAVQHAAVPATWPTPGATTTVAGSRAAALAGGGRVHLATACARPKQPARACAIDRPLRRDGQRRCPGTRAATVRQGRRDAGADVAGRGRRGRLPPGRRADRLGALVPSPCRCRTFELKRGA